MTYADVIPLIEREVVTDGLWGSDSEKEKDLRNLLYAAAVSIATDMPLSEFTLSTSTQNVENDIPEQAPLPDDQFTYRNDRGIRSLVIDGKRYMMGQQNSYRAVLSLSDNTAFIEDTDMIFAVDIPSNSIYGVNLGPSVEVEYLPIFSQPQPSEIDTEEFPLSGKNLQETVQTVAAHLSGGRKNDGQQAQFNMILSNLYGGRNDG